MRYMFELSGEHPDLPVWEAEALLSCHGKAELLEKDNLLAILSSKAEPCDFKERVSLSHHLSEHLASIKVEELERFFEKLLLSDLRSASVRVKLAEPRKKALDSVMLGRRLGEIISDEVKIDLTNPEMGFRVYIGEMAHVGKDICEIDRSQYEKRKNRLLPYASPVSIHPRLARALINLTAKKTDSTLLDPFCGTGTLLIEAALMGMKTYGSDMSSKMIEGSGKNLRHMGLSAKTSRLDVGDIDKIGKKFDCIVTDPPYGKSSSTNKEPVDDLYARALESFSRNLVDGGRVGIIIPDKRRIDYEASYRLLKKASIRVHRSLVRNILILEKT